MPTARGILKPSALAVELTDTHPAKAIAPQLADINSPSEQVPPFKVLSPPEQTAHRQRARAAFYAREAAAAVPSATLHDIFAAAPARPFRVSFGLEGERSFGFADRPNALERHDEGVAPVRLVAFEEPFAAKIVDYVHGGLVLGDPNIERIACDYVQTSITDALAVFYGPGVTPPRSERLALEERIERATLEQAEVMRERAEAIRAPARGAPDRKAWIDRRKNYERDWTEHHQLPRGPLLRCAPLPLAAPPQGAPRQELRAPVPARPQSPRRV